MILEKVKTSQKYYSVGYCAPVDKYMMAVLVTRVAWYEQYFEISEEEYNSFDTGALDDLYEQICRIGTSSSRFLFSDKNGENTKAQLALRDKAYGN